MTHKNMFPTFNFDIHQNKPVPAGEGKRGSYTHFGNTMIFAKLDEESIKDLRAAVMILLRNDGFLGFPGGETLTGESVIDGVNRRMQEEIGLDLSKHRCTGKDYMVTYKKPGTDMLFHFFAKEVSFKDFLLIESTAMSSEQYGKKVLGCMRIPLCTLEKSRGWPAFLKNNFAENSKQQMCQALLMHGILEPSEIPQPM